MKVVCWRQKGIDGKVLLSTTHEQSDDHIREPFKNYLNIWPQISILGTIWPPKNVKIHMKNMKTFTKIFVNLANWVETKSVFVQIVIEWDWIADHVLINAILAGAEDLFRLFLT